MQEAAYATLTSQLHAYCETGEVPPRTGNASHGRVPINVYPTNDGYVAMNLAVEEHWHNLLQAMGREDLRDDPRFTRQRRARRAIARRPTRRSRRGRARSARWRSSRSPNGIASRSRRCATSTRSCATATCTSAACSNGSSTTRSAASSCRTRPLRFHGADPVRRAQPEARPAQ